MDLNAIKQKLDTLQSKPQSGQKLITQQFIGDLQ